MPVLFDNKLCSNPFHPYSYLIIFVFMQFGLGAFSVLIGWVESSHYLNNFVEAASLISVSCLLIWVGFVSKVGERLSKTFPMFVFKIKEDSTDLNRSIFKTSIILYGLGWMGRIYQLMVGYSHKPIDIGGALLFLSILQALSLFSQLAFATILYLVFSLNRKKLPLKFLVGGLILLEVMAGFLFGGRTSILIPFLIVIIVYHYTVRHISWSKVIVGFAILLLFLIPVTTVYRAIYYKAIEQGELGLTGVFGTLKKMGEEDVKSRDNWSELVGQSLSRVSSMFDGTLRVLDRVPSMYKFQHGRTFLPDLFIFFIPRIIWPNKPLFRQGRKFAILFWDMPEGEFGTSAGIGLPAELYFNFGWLGILLCPIWGVAIRFFWERAKYYMKYEKIPVIRLIFVLFTLSQVNKQILGYWCSIIREGIFYYVFLILLYRQVPRIVRIAKNLIVEKSLEFND